MLHFHTVLLALHNSYKQPLSALEETFCHTATHHTLIYAHPHLVLAVTAALHPPPALPMSPTYVNSLTFSTSSNNFSSCSTFSACKISCKQVTLYTPAHLPWIHMPHYSLNQVNLFSQTADPTWLDYTFRQAILCDATADHHFGFPKINIYAIAVKSLPFSEHIHEYLDCHVHQDNVS